MDWYRIILDEAHQIKNRTARASRAAYELRGERRWALTGTPIVNRLEDLASLLHFIKVCLLLVFFLQNVGYLSDCFVYWSNGYLIWFFLLVGTVGSFSIF